MCYCCCWSWCNRSAASHGEQPAVAKSNWPAGWPYGTHEAECRRKATTTRKNEWSESESATWTRRRRKRKQMDKIIIIIVIIIIIIIITIAAIIVAVVAACWLVVWCAAGMDWSSSQLEQENKSMRIITRTTTKERCPVTWLPVCLMGTHQTRAVANRMGQRLKSTNLTCR